MFRSLKESPINKPRLNNEIKATSVRLVGEDGSQLGIVSLDQAKLIAQEAGLDLAEIAPSAAPPVVKIIDWGKYRYEQTKQDAKNRKNQKQTEVKQIRMGLKIGEHDIDVKLRNARKFLEEGNTVKLTARFRGREITHPELGHQLLDRVLAKISDIAERESAPAMTGRDLSMIIKKKKQTKEEVKESPDA